MQTDKLSPAHTVPVTAVLVESTMSDLTFNASV